MKPFWNSMKVSQIQTMDRHGSFHNCTFFVGTIFFQFDWAVPFDGKEDKLWFWVGAVSKLDKGIQSRGIQTSLAGGLPTKLLDYR